MPGKITNSAPMLALNGYICGAPPYLSWSLTSFPALTAGTVLPASSRLFLVVSYPPTLCDLLWNPAAYILSLFTTTHPIPLLLVLISYIFSVWLLTPLSVSFPPFSTSGSLIPPAFFLLWFTQDSPVECRRSLCQKCQTP